jgi:NAD(P)-dependent dehydrogenase (short-subunit alcohol dehydrogenase family)
MSTRGASAGDESAGGASAGRDSAAAVAMITGAGGGIGGAIAARLASDGYTVAATDQQIEPVRTVVDAIVQAGGNARAYALDVTDPQRARAVVAEVVGDFGHLDVLVNCAGIQFNAPTVDLAPEDYRRVLEVNLSGTVFCCQAAGRHMIGQGGGVIVNISSMASRFGWPRRVPYAITKAGVTALTRSLAVEWAPHNIRVVAVAPGYVATPLVRTAFERGHIRRDDVLAEIPQRRIAEPEEIAGLVAYLISSEARYITGEEIVIDGGFSVYKI